MARYPHLGEVKTRLARTIGDPGALDVYRQLLTRATKLVAGLEADNYCRTVFVTPAETCQAFTDDYPGLDQYQAQASGDLGRRMQHALGDLLSLEGVKRACLIGADAPELKPATLEVAFDFLDDHDLVLGPSLDGGYYLIGLNRVRPELFDGINWGTDTVLKATLEAAKRSGLQVAMLPQLRDLDDATDLEYFAQTGLIKTTRTQDSSDS
jgi:rSAM/selenodomain-associated transferase 1